MSGNTHTTSKQNSHKPYKNYTQVAFQQGKPVLDYELNDAQAVVLQQLTNHLQTLDQFCGIETSPSEFAIIPLSHANNGATPRNQHNFGITLGRLPTRLGVIDTMPLRSSTKGNVIAFDYHGLNGNELASDHLYANYILKGKITASTNTSITDTTKDFSKSYLDLVGNTTTFDLLGITDTLTVGVKTNGADIIITNATNTALNGQRRSILSVTDANTITFANLSGLTIGDEYVIVPRNNLSSIVSSYDAQSDIALTKPAKESNPIVAIFVQSFIDDIASEEDSEIKLSQIGMETTHRKQLRWCVRTFQFYIQESEWTKLQSSTIDYTSDVLGAYTPYDNPIDFAKYNTFITSSNDSILLENGVLKNELSTQITPLSLTFGVTQLDSLQKAYNSVYQAKGISAQSLMLRNKASVLSAKMIKALILQTLLGNTELDVNDATTEELLDISVLQLHSSSTKSVGTQTMSPYFYAGMNVNPPLGADSVIPMFTAWKSSYPTDENATIIDGYFYLPPRIFQSQSQISTELLQAKSMTYSFGYKEQFDDFGALILDETNPSYNLLPFTFKSIVSLTKSISSLDETYPTTNVAFDTLAEKLAFNDVSALFILGIGSAYKISLGNSTNSIVANIPTLSATGFENAIHLGFSGQLQSSGSLNSNTFLSDLSTNHQHFGGIIFANPITQNNISSKVALNQIANDVGSGSNSSVGYYVPTEVSVNGNPSHFISATSDKGFSFYTDEDKLQVREFHQGIAQASVFANTFNLRKLAIKTQASVEADLFTIDVPHVLEQFKDQSIQSSIPAQLLGDAEQTGIDNPSLIPQILSSFAGYKETDLLAQNGIRTNQSPIRTFLGNTFNTGNLSHSSQSSIFRGSYQTLSLFKDGLNTKLFTKEALTYDLSSNTIDDDRIAHDGSTPLENLYSQLDRTFITEEDAYQLPDTLLDYEWGAWAVKKIGVDKFDTNTTLQELPSLSTYTNRNSSATLRYHVGDFYPGQNDERGIPRNLLVDTMNLFVKLEPLPLVHWYTMPKHQHSVLQGSLDVAEAVATLLDISHGRGIPDHLFNKALPFTTKSRNSNILGNDNGEETQHIGAKLNVQYLLDPSDTSNDQASFDLANTQNSGYTAFEMSGYGTTDSSTTFKIIHSWLGHQFSETLQGYHLPKSTVLSVAEKEDIRNGSASPSLSAFMLSNNGLLNVGDIDPTGISLPNHAQPFIHWYHPNMDNIKSKETTLTYGFGATLPEMSMYAKWGRRSLIIPALVPFDNNVISQATFQGVYQTVSGSYHSTQSSGTDDIDGIFVNNTGVATTDIFDLTEYTSSMGAMVVISESDTATDSQQIDVLQSIGETYQASQSAPVYPMHSSGLNGKFIIGDTVTTYDNEEISRSQFYQNHFPMIINSTRAMITPSSSSIASSNYIARIKNILSVNGSPRPVYLPASAYFYNNPVENVNNSATTSDETITNDPNAVSNELNAMKHGAGFHPAINWIGRSFSTIKSTITNTTFDAQAKRDFDFRSFPIDEDQLIYEPTIRAELETNSTFNASSDFSGLLGSETAWSTPAMRACLNTDTVAYLNLMTKTYQFTAGHDSIHPYDDDTAFSDSKTIPQWMQQSFKSGYDRVPGKGVATNTDTQHVGAMGTNINTTGSSLFFDERLLGTSFYGNIGQHGSSKATAVFRDLFDFTSYNIIQAIATEKTNALKFTPMISAFAKSGMQSKLLYNCSLRVLHSRPNNAITGQATAPRSLTELFICVDGDNNQLIQLPRTSFDKSTYKPYIHVQGVSKTLNHEYLATQENHPNHPYMKHLDNMICDTLGIGQTQSSANPYIVENGNGYNDAIPTATFLSDDPCNCDGEPLPQIKHQTYTQARNGDTFNADPFDFAWDRSLVETNTTTNAKALNPMIQGNASNSGIEYELISSLTALHSKANTVGLTSNIGASTRYTLQDLIPTANEMTLPGDHEITFVLYTGKHGQSFVEDMPETFNPAVAGCHLKATLEINRPSQYLSSTAESNIHYGKTIGGNPIQTYAIAGAKPSVLSNLRVFSVPFNYFVD